MIATAEQDKISPESLQKILDNMSAGCQIIDRTYRYRYVNKAVAKQGRSSKSKLLGRTMMEMYPGIQQTLAFKHIRICMKTRKPQQIDSEFEFPDGSIGWFELQIEPIKEGVIIFSVDVTVRKKIEQMLIQQNLAMHEARKELEYRRIQAEAMLESLGEAVIAVDANRKIILVNYMCQEMLGWKEHELLGQDVATLYLEDSNHKPVKFEERPTYKAIATGELVSNEQVQGKPLHNERTPGNIVQDIYYLGRKDGSVFPIKGAVNPIKLKKRLLGAIITFRDISEELESDRIKSEFVSLASHQLRTPLGISKWYLEAIQDAHLLKGTSLKLQELMKKVYENNERVLALVRDLLSVSRIDQGRIKDVPQKVDIREMLDKIIDEMRVIANPRKVSLDFTIQKGIKSIWIDIVRIREVLENLIANGIKYNKPGGSVKLSVAKTTKSLLIKVKDTGMGVSNYDQKSLFTKFFRSKKAVLVNPGGSGLGLYVAKKYIEAWKGTIAFTSEVGRGTTFTITLPANLINRGTNEKNTHR